MTTRAELHEKVKRLEIALENAGKRENEANAEATQARKALHATTAQLDAAETRIHNLLQDIGALQEQLERAEDAARTWEGKHNAIYGRCIELENCDRNNKNMILRMDERITVLSTIIERAAEGMRVLAGIEMTHEQKNGALHFLAESILKPARPDEWLPF